MNSVDLAIIGLGNVGRRFVSLLHEREALLSDEYGIRCRVVGTSTRRNGSTFDGQPCRDAFEVIERLARSTARLRIAVETTTLSIDDGEPAVSHVRAALDAGCHVVSANKGPVAFAYRALRDAARRAGVEFRFEGAVMDGVPVFNLVRETLPAVQIRGFEGVVNTTTNHIITALDNGEDFDDALAKMQQEGIAEADPSLDVDGWDAAAKTSALANVLLDADTTPHHVHRRGLDASTAEDVRAARARGYRLKLVASAQRDASGALSLRVEPRELPPDHLLAGLGGNANALILETDLLERIAICQLSSGLTQTAYALLSDMISIIRRHTPAERMPVAPRTAHRAPRT